jgi:hypothetical protein
MCSNTTQRKAQAAILRAAVADYSGWRLITDCGACGPRSMASRELPPVTMMQVLLRLRCRSCGARVASAALANDLPGWRGRVVRIWGSGSYGG